MSNGDTPELELIGTIIASLVIASFCVFILGLAFGAAALAMIPTELLLLYGLVVTLSIIQVVGVDALTAWRGK